MKEKYNLDTPEDWNTITATHIKSNGGSTILKKFTIYELKRMACPEGKSSFKVNQPTGYWKNKENVLTEIKQKYHLVLHF